MTNKGGELIIIGAGGHAKVVIATAQAAGYAVTGVFDDDPAARGRSVLGVPVRGRCCDIEPSQTETAVLAIGNNAVRRRLAEEFASLSWVTLVHPAATVHPTARIAAGTVIFAGAVIQPDATLGAHAVINTGASIDHDCSIGDFVHVAPGTRLAGNVQIGEGTLMGIGSAVAPNVNIGAWSVLGAGSVAICDIPAGVVAAGVPARVLKTLEVQ